MSLKHVTGSCHCGAVRYETELDLSKGTIRCNCSICTKARAWFTFVNDEHFHLLADEDNMSVYQWTSPNLTRKTWVVPDLPLLQNMRSAHLRDGKRRVHGRQILRARSRHARRRYDRRAGRCSTEVHRQPARSLRSSTGRHAALVEIRAA